MLNERFGGTTRDNSLIEDLWDKYQELILTGLPSKPTDNGTPRSEPHVARQVSAAVGW